MTHWIKPAALSNDPPRNAKVKFEIIILPIILLFFVWLVPILIAPPILGTQHEEKTLRERGKDINGIVISKNIIKSKNSEFYEIWYEYEIFEKGGNRKIKQKGSISIEENFMIFVGGSVKILYDQNKPYISRININDKFQNNPNFTKEGFLVFFVSLFILLPGIVSFLCVFPFYGRAYREKRLLRVGRAAPATLVEMKHSSLRGLPLVRLTFCFVDDAGVSVQGSYGPYVTGRSGDPTAASAWERTLSSLTVVYDPKDSRKNLLYPAHYAELR